MEVNWYLKWDQTQILAGGKLILKIEKIPFVYWGFIFLSNQHKPKGCHF